MAPAEEVFGRLKRVPDALAQATPKALRAAGAAAAPVMERAPGAARRVGGHAIHVSSRLINESTLSVKWGPPGWVRVLNDRTQAHYIARRGGRGRGALGSLRKQNLESGMGRKSIRAGRLLMGELVGSGGVGLVRGAIKIKGIGYRAYAHHPGTKGKHFVERGKRMARPVIVKTYATKSVTEPMRQVLR